jgi:hypothetical protein
VGLNIIQQLIYNPLKGNVLQWGDAGQLYHAGDIRKPYASHPSVATVASVNMWRAMIIRKHIDPSTNAF